MSDLSLREPFGQIDLRESRGASFGASFLVQGIAVAILVNLTFGTPEFVTKHYETVTLTAPVEQEEAVLKPAPKPRVVVQQPKIVTPPPMARREARIEAPKPPEIKVQEQAPVLQAKVKIPVAPPSRFFESAPDLPTAPKANKQVLTNSFGTGSSATPTLGNRPAQQVQTGGFGDPNGVPATGKGTGKGLAIAKLGSFDLPEGPGYGNGTGGARGARGTVASAGFGNGTAIQGGGRNTGPQRVVQTAFTAPEPVAAATPKKAVTADSGFTPFTILSKPLPSYTDEGRKRRIEGEVQLEVVFQASGHIRVVRVLRGLGYGLDEAAIAAAQKIQFLPAKRGGQAVDAEARIRMVFQLT